MSGVALRRRSSQLLLPHGHPFNYKDTISTYELCKYLVMGPLILPIRLLLSIMLFTCVGILSRIAILGLSVKQLQSEPLPWYRKVLILPVRFLARGLLFLGGFYWVTVRGQAAPKSVAPILTIAPHTNLFETFWFVFEVGAAAFSRMENAAFPFVGDYLLASQGILASRQDRNSRSAALDAIKKRVADPEFPHMMIFPEGTCSNRSALIAFKQGAYVPGLPVQPVVMRTHWRHFDPCLSSAAPDITVQFVRGLCQFVNWMEVEYLPVYYPSAEEKAHPDLFARNVRAMMAARLGVPTTEHSYEDVWLAGEAVHKGLNVDCLNASFSELKQLVPDITGEENKRLLSKFLAADKDRDGNVDFADVARSLGAKESDPAMRSLFLTILSGSGVSQSSSSLTYRDFVLGLARLRQQLCQDDALKAAWTAIFGSAESTHIAADAFHAAFRSCACLEGLDDRRIWRSVKEADKDQDGKISQDEFHAFVQARPEYVFLLSHGRV